MYSAAPELTATQRRLRRLNLITLLPVLALTGALVVANDTRHWWQGIVLAAGVLTALVGVERWTAGDFLRFAKPCLAITWTVWLFGALTASGAAFFSVSVVGPMIIPLLRRHRLLAALALAGCVAVAGSARFLVMTDGDFTQNLLQYVVAPTAVIFFVTALMFPSQRIYDLLLELEQSREREAELAVVRERMRFASDLHDIQGHTLHVVKLKVALAEKLLDSDPDRVRRELSEVRVLVGDTITQTKELAYSQRRLNLSTELENAKNLFEAAGILVRVERKAEVDVRAAELLGQGLRETTTNILRHAQAAQVRITLSASGIAIANDGAQDGPLPRLRGLSTLRERLADNGGELTVEQRDGRFLTAAEFPRKDEA
ncbi:sensor histidine kinase [Amycolatopsis sp. cg5]|uniref:sensor histidine kinase n=1 Tax=Amycolatopsis sp. cg5 TaxID=3238802 RepID=UPI003524D5DA